MVGGFYFHFAERIINFMVSLLIISMIDVIISSLSHEKFIKLPLNLTK